MVDEQNTTNASPEQKRISGKEIQQTLAFLRGVKLYVLPSLESLAKPMDSGVREQVETTGIEVGSIANPIPSVERQQELAKEFWLDFQQGSDGNIRKRFGTSDPHANIELLIKDGIIRKDPRVLLCLKDELDLFETKLDQFNATLKSFVGGQRQDFGDQFEQLLSRYEGMAFPTPEDAREISSRLQRICKGKLNRRFESWKSESPGDMVFHGVGAKYGYVAIRGDDGSFCTTPTIRKFKLAPSDDEVGRGIDLTSNDLEHPTKPPQSEIDKAA